MGVPSSPTCLLEGHPQRTHVDIRGHPASFELAGSTDQHSCRDAGQAVSVEKTLPEYSPRVSEPPRIPPFSLSTFVELVFLLSAFGSSVLEPDLRAEERGGGGTRGAR